MRCSHSEPVCGSVADEVPPSYTASPEVYKVLAENDEMRVVLATWQPGHKAGSARVNPPVKSHTFQNIGNTECQQVLVERKK